MAGSTEADSNVKSDAEVYPLGKSRPPLAVDDLPEPEEVFKVSRLGPAADRPVRHRAEPHRPGHLDRQRRVAARLRRRSASSGSSASAG